jgi:hypothetical protein
MRQLSLIALIVLAGCGYPMRETAEPVVVVEEPAIAPDADCQAGDDDGIGGTGCKLD